ncbi:hypothetical protein M2281_005610 [Mesorhizobium soli]|uniref:hypothetical protein n=1 Tax=Pseudaminobacter soli (ex Li et al. 2025) TaxID=1295366 RepID=UPI0024752403|nr:hypothetical protein [Mesorhizobium soli]MDH6234988.1 hypothetical protein [Mesorhizobium soli]
MADSDHSMSLACVTRRMAIAGWIAAAAGWQLGGVASARDGIAPGTLPDPALELWRNWAAAHQRAQRLCRRQQELETELAERIDFVGTVVRPPGGEETVICSLEALDRLVGARTDMATTRARAAAELAARQAYFDAAAAEIGYFTGLRAERAAFARVEALLSALATTSAVSLAGVAGKLDAILHEGEVWEDCSAFPWPQIRAARDDLVRIGRQTAPGAFFPDD